MPYCQNKLQDLQHCSLPAVQATSLSSEENSNREEPWWAGTSKRSWNKFPVWVWPDETTFSFLHICLSEKSWAKDFFCTFITEEPVLTLCKFTSIKHVLYVTANSSKPGSGLLQTFKFWIIHYMLRTRHILTLSSQTVHRRFLLRFYRSNSLGHWEQCEQTQRCSCKT